MTRIENRVGYPKDIFSSENVEQAVLWLSTLVFLTSLALEGQFDKDVRLRIIKEQQNRCYRCGRQFPNDKLYIHHILPKSMGGTDKLFNAMALCEGCHRYADDLVFKKGQLMTGIMVTEVVDEDPALISNTSAYNRARKQFLHR